MHPSDKDKANTSNLEKSFFGYISLPLDEYLAEVTSTRSNFPFFKTAKSHEQALVMDLKTSNPLLSKSTATLNSPTHPTVDVGSVGFGFFSLYLILSNFLRQAVEQYAFVFLLIPTCIPLKHCGFAQFLYLICVFILQCLYSSHNRTIIRLFDTKSIIGLLFILLSLTVPAFSQGPVLKQSTVPGQQDAINTANNLDNIPVASLTGPCTIGQIVTCGGDGFPTIWSTGITGTTTNDNASAGKVGEYISSATANGSGYELYRGVSSAYFAQISFSLTAGDWNVSAIGCIGLNGATMAGQNILAINTSVNPGVHGNSMIDISPEPTGSQNVCAAIPSYRISISTTTTIYEVTNIAFGPGTPNVAERLSAIRAR
jgi:hypothetical protein